MPDVTIPCTVCILANNLARLDDNKIVFSNYLRSLGISVFIADVNTLRYVSGVFVADGARIEETLTLYDAVGRAETTTLDTFDLLWLFNQPAPCFGLDAWSILFALNQRVRFVNAIAPMYLANSKAFLPGILHDNQLPETVISHYVDDHVGAMDTWGRTILKPPSDGCGNSVFMIAPGDTNAYVIVQSMCGGGSGDHIHNAAVVGLSKSYAVAQRFLPHETEFRVILAGRTCVGAYKKAKPETDHRANLSQGGQILPYDMSEAEIVRYTPIAERLADMGINFCGLDVINGRVLEFNLVDPGGPHLRAELGGDLLCAAIWSAVLREIGHG